MSTSLALSCTAPLVNVSNFFLCTCDPAMSVADLYRSML